MQVVASAVEHLCRTGLHIVNARGIVDVELGSVEHIGVFSFAAAEWQVDKGHYAHIIALPRVGQRGGVCLAVSVAVPVYFVAVNACEGGSEHIVMHLFTAACL